MLEAVVDSGGAGDDELLSALTLCEGTARRLDRVTVSSVAALSRRGAFAERGYRSSVSALGDLLGWERFEARRRVVAAEQVCPRVGLDGAVLPPRLPATAGVFTAGEAGLRHVDVVAEVLGSAAAGRLTPQVWAGAEADLAAKAQVYTPAELRSYGVALVEALDADGAEPDDRPSPPVNELYLTRSRRGGGGTLKGRFDDAAVFDAIATLIDAHAAPLSAEDRRPVPQRQAEALGDICGFVLDHGEVPERGGRRPHLNVLISLADLEGRCRSAVLDLGGSLTPARLRMLACDAAVVPIVLGGAGQPLDVGRATRTIPDGIRRAVAARDRGCAYPGCGRPISWTEIHHIAEWVRDHGETRVENCVALCRAHHRQFHDESGWEIRMVGGIPEFIPPAWICPDRIPRRRPLPHLIAGT